MAQLDVTELMSDPDLVDSLVLITRFPSVNNRGENLIRETSQPTVGVVQPADGKVVDRLPEALREKSVSSFWVKGTIIASSDGKYSSVICLNGIRYNVKTVNDFSNWGAGYCEGTCVAEPPA